MKALSQQEVADLFGVSRMAVWKVEQRALKKIARAMQDEAAKSGKTLQAWLRDE